jgi:hypothetical protein
VIASESASLFGILEESSWFPCIDLVEFEFDSGVGSAVFVAAAVKVVVSVAAAAAAADRRLVVVVAVAAHLPGMSVPMAMASSAALKEAEVSNPSSRDVPVSQEPLRSQLDIHWTEATRSKRLPHSP